jgi:hypothetical protein
MIEIKQISMAANLKIRGGHATHIQNVQQVDPNF